LPTALAARTPDPKENFVRISISCVTVASFACVAVSSAAVSAQVTQRASVASSGAQANGDSLTSLSISADGRFVAFANTASNLVPNDVIGATDIFVRDRWMGTTERVSVDSSGAEANAASSAPAISADGRYVAFLSGATNLAVGDTNHLDDVFVRDRLNGTTERVNVATSGSQANGATYLPLSISADGRYVAFGSDASNLVTGDTNGFTDVFVRDRMLATTERVSVSSTGAEGNGASQRPSISADGRYVAFHSTASLDPLDTNGVSDVYVRDRQTGTTERVSVAINMGGQADGDSSYASISADGRYVAFRSFATNLVAGDTNGKIDIFVRDRQLATTVRASVSSGGVQSDGDADSACISPDGRYVAFSDLGANLVSGDTNLSFDIFVRDLQSATTERASVDSNGAQANAANYTPVISSGGRFTAFDSFASNLVPGDTNGAPDIFVHDRDSTAFTSLCFPGQDGVIACPCSNPPSAPGRGCNNSSSTGGAMLTAAGSAYLSMDTLVLTSSGEKPTALSIFSQGSAANIPGFVFGQGVRCASTNLKRLYTKSASAGIANAPTGADPSVHARSAALGDPIAAGTSRYYYVYYRDQTVLGGCPAASTFNATQTGRVDWSL
jgi:Tol biopolymer transport system component